MLADAKRLGARWIKPSLDFKGPEFWPAELPFKVVALCT